MGYVIFDLRILAYRCLSLCGPPDTPVHTHDSMRVQNEPFQSASSVLWHMHVLLQEDNVRGLTRQFLCLAVALWHYSEPIVRHRSMHNCITERHSGAQPSAHLRRASRAGTEIFPKRPTARGEKAWSVGRGCFTRSGVPPA